MFEKQVTALTAILKDTDIQSYAGDGFWNIVKAVSLGDAGALLDSANDIKNLVFHKESPKQPQCPPEKVKLIEEALRYFKMIP